MRSRPALAVSLCAIVLPLVVVGLQKPHVGDKNHVGDDNHVEPDMCTRLMERIYHGRVFVPSPPDVTGEWASERCEVRPGPEYVLRKYHFVSTTHFTVYLYHYADSDCTRPIYLVRASGSYKFLLDSWTTRGATEVEYQLTKVVLMAYTEDTAVMLGTRVNNTCPDLNISWKPFELYEIYTYTDVEGGGGHGLALEEEGYVVVDKDCTEALYFSLHELQLMRVEERRHHHHGLVRMLYLGDIHTDRKQRQTHRPTSYQDPLLPIQQEGCGVCHALNKAGGVYPPTLKHSHSATLALPGEWFSERCEIRPIGMFLTRRLIFDKDNRTWQGFYYHYDDALCRQPTFTIYARGSYQKGHKSGEVDGAYNFDFKVHQVKITPGDRQLVSTLNTEETASCGEKGAWKIGEEHDVTGTGGCRALGIIVPHVEYELVRMRKEHHKLMLYLGQRPSDGSHPSNHRLRPTSFQPPLIKCDRPITVAPPSVRKYPQSSGGSSRLTAPTAVVILTFIHSLHYFITL